MLTFPCAQVHCPAQPSEYRATVSARACRRTVTACPRPQSLSSPMTKSKKPLLSLSTNSGSFTSAAPNPRAKLSEMRAPHQRSYRCYRPRQKLWELLRQRIATRKRTMRMPLFAIGRPCLRRSRPKANLLGLPREAATSPCATQSCFAGACAICAAVQENQFTTIGPIGRILLTPIRVLSTPATYACVAKRRVIPTASQLQGQARMGRCLQRFMHCLRSMGDPSTPG